MKKNNVIAIIPARKGSKGLKNKNLLKIKKKSLVEIALRNANFSKFIDEIYISSDSDEILKEAKNFPKTKIHKRSKKAATDTAGSKEVLKDFFNKNRSLMLKNPIIVYIQPSSPMNKASHLDKAIKTFRKLKKDTLISCYKPYDGLKEKIYKSLFLSKKKNLQPLFGKNSIVTNRQKIKNILLPNGAFFIFKVKKNFFNNFINLSKSYGYIMKKNEAIDINNYRDFLEAKKILNKYY